MIGTLHQRPQSKRINQNIQPVRPITRSNAREQAQKCFKMAKQHMEKHQIEKSIEFYIQATIHDPNYYQAYCNMGTCFRTLGNFIQAVSSYLKAVNIKPDDSITNYNLANAYRIIGDEEKAVKLYKFVIKQKQQKNLQLGSIYSNSYTNLGICYKNVGDYSNAIECYEKAQKISPNDNSITFNHAMCLKKVIQRLSDDEAFSKLKAQKIQKAKQLFKKVVDIDSSNQMALLSLIQLKYIKDKSEQTLNQCINQFKALTQKNQTKVQIKEQANQKIAYCLNLLKKYDQSIKQYKKSLQAVQSRKKSIQIVQQKSQNIILQESKKEINQYDITQQNVQKKSQPKIQISNTLKSNPKIQQIKKEEKKSEKIIQNLIEKHLPLLRKLCEDKKFDQCYQKINILEDGSQKKELLIIIFNFQAQSEQSRQAAQSAYKIYIQHFHKTSTDLITFQMFNFQTHKAMASILTFLGKNQQAIKHYEIISQSISKSKQNEQANLTQLHSGLGVNYQSQGLHQKAVQQFKKALELQPNNINLLYNLGFCYQSANKNKEASEIYQKFLQKIEDQQDLEPEIKKSYTIDCMINIAYCSEGTKEQISACEKAVQKLQEFYNNDSAAIVKNLDESIIMNFYLKVANLYEDEIQKQFKKMGSQSDQQKIKVFKQKLLKIFLILLDFQHCPDRQQVLINCGNIFYQEREYLNSLNFYQRLNKYKNLVINNIALAFFNLNQYERALNNMIYAMECQPQNYIYKINFCIMCWVFGIQNQVAAQTINKKIACKCESQFNSRFQFGKGLILKLTNRILSIMRKNDYDFNSKLVNQNNFKETFTDLLDQNQKDSDWLDIQSKLKHQFLHKYLKEHIKKHSYTQNNQVLSQILKIALKQYSSERQTQQNLRNLLNKLNKLPESQKKMSITQFCLSFFIYLNQKQSNKIIQILKNFIGQQQLQFINFRDQEYPLQDGFSIKQYKIQYPTEIKLKNIIHSLIQWESSLQDNMVYILKVIQSLAYKKDLRNSMVIDYKFPHCKNIETCQQCLKKTILICAKMLKVTPKIQCDKQIKKFSNFKSVFAHQYQAKFNQTAKNSVKDNILKYQLSKDILPLHIRLNFNTFSCCQEFINQLCITYNAEAVKVKEPINKQISLVINKLVKIRCSWKQSDVLKEYVLKFINYPLGIKSLSALFLDAQTNWIGQVDKEVQQLLKPFKGFFSEQINQSKS